jgi:hypothetical protein
MATNMLSASTSHHHQPYSSVSGPSSAGYPNIATSTKPELAFAPFQESCTTFLALLDAFVLGAKGEILQRKEGRELEREKEAKERRRLEEEIIGAGSKESRLLEGQYRIGTCVKLSACVSAGWEPYALGQVAQEETELTSTYRPLPTLSQCSRRRSRTSPSCNRRSMSSRRISRHSSRRRRCSVGISQNGQRRSTSSGQVRPTASHVLRWPSRLLLVWLG